MRFLWYQDLGYSKSELDSVLMVSVLDSDQAVQVQALAGVTVHLSTQEYKWIPANIVSR